MNTRLKMALLLHSSESGFAIVIAVALGLIMVLVGLTMTIRSQGDQILASTQKQTEQSLAAAEKGAAFYQGFFNISGSNRRLAQYPDCTTNRINSNPGAACSDPNTTTSRSQMSWSNVQNIKGMATACNLSNITDIKNVYASTDWKDANNPFQTNRSLFGKLQFRLVSYQYRLKTAPNPEIGTLIVEGRVTPQGNNNTSDAITRLEVNIPITPGEIETIKMPGVWVGSLDNTSSGDADGTGSNNGIKGDILINNCAISNTAFSAMQTRIAREGDYKVKKVDITMPSVPNQPNSGRERVVADPARGISSQTGVIPLGALNRADITLPNLTPGPSNDDNFKVTFNNELTYVYSVSSINNSTIRIKPGAKIAIFLSGDIDRNTEIYCEDSDLDNGTRGTCNPMDLKIFGTGPAGSQICVNGGRELNAFILAPNYNIGVNGGGNLTLGRGAGAVPIGNIRGAVWAKQWGEGTCGSNSVNLLVEQAGNWSDLQFPTIGNELPSQLPPRVYPAGAWQRQRVN